MLVYTRKVHYEALKIKDLALSSEFFSTHILPHHAWMQSALLTDYCSNITSVQIFLQHSNWLVHRVQEANKIHLLPLLWIYLYSFQKYLLMWSNEYMIQSRARLNIWGLKTLINSPRATRWEVLGPELTIFHSQAESSTTEPPPAQTNLFPFLNFFIWTCQKCILTAKLKL